MCPLRFITSSTAIGCVFSRILPKDENDKLILIFIMINIRNKRLD